MTNMDTLLDATWPRIFAWFAALLAGGLGIGAATVLLFAYQLAPHNIAGGFAVGLSGGVGGCIIGAIAGWPILRKR